MIKKSHYTLLFIILGSIALNFLNSPLSESFFDDKEIFKYAGLVIYKGGIPYRDFFDHKPPLIYFFNYFHWISPWIPWMLDSLLILFASLLFYWLCRKNKLAWPWFLPLLFNLLIRYSLVSFGNGMTREYTAVFLLIFFCVVEGNARYKYYILGLLTGLTAWMQQDGLITLAPFLFYSLFSERGKARGVIRGRVLAVLAGFVTISLPVVFYFNSHQSLGYMWRDAFVFNLKSPGSHVGLFDKLKTVKHALHEAEYEMAFYTALVLGIVALFLKNKKPRLLYSALLVLALSFVGELLTGRLSASPGFIYYLLPLAASIPILVYTVFTETHVSFMQDKTAQLIFCLILSTTLFLGTLRYAAGFRVSKNQEAGFAGNPATEYLKTQSLSDYELFVFDDSNLIYLYNEHRILSPSPWIYHYYWGWDPEWDRENKIFPTIIGDLQLHKTRFILDCSEAKHNIRSKMVLTEWQQFLQNNYSLVIKDSSGRKLWRIQ